MQHTSGSQYAPKLLPWPPLLPSGGRRASCSSYGRARGSDAAELSPEYLRDQVLMLLVGGHETTATTLCWALHCLMQDRPARDQLRDELQRAGAESGDLERLRELPYLGAVIDESMRLYPITR